MAGWRCVGILATVLLCVHTTVSFPSPRASYMLGKRAAPAVNGRYGGIHRALAATLPTSISVHDIKQEGYYWTYIEIGTPPQLFSVIVDTGSGLTDVPCKGCAKCSSHMDSSFDPSASSTATNVMCRTDECSLIPSSHCGSNKRCSYVQRYAEGSMLSGNYINDRVSLGTPNRSPAVAMPFGCHTEETNLFLTQTADGIMGLNQQDRTVLGQMHMAGVMHDYIFSLCLSTVGGYFGVGGVNTSSHVSEPVFIPLSISSSGYYSVSLQTVDVGDVELPVSSSVYTRRTGCIVDSGTTFTYFPDVAYSALTYHLRNACAAGGCQSMAAGSEPLCFLFGTPNFTLPTLTYKFDTGSVTMPPSQYLSPMEHGGSTLHCLGIYTNGNDGMVLGTNVMRGYDVIFDVDNQQVGFAVATCGMPYAECDGCMVSQLHPKASVTVYVIIGLAVGLAVITLVVLRVRKRSTGQARRWQPVSQDDDDDSVMPPPYDQAVRQPQDVQTVEMSDVRPQSPVSAV